MAGGDGLGAFWQSLLRTCAGHAFEAAGLFGHPLAEAQNLGMSTQPLNCVPFAFQLFFRQDSVDLRMTRAADPDGLLNDVPVKLAFVFAIMMPCPRDEVVARERLKPSANGALSVHVLGVAFLGVIREFSRFSVAPVKRVERMERLERLEERTR